MNNSQKSLKFSDNSQQKKSKYKNRFKNDMKYNINDFIVLETKNDKIKDDNSQCSIEPIYKMSDFYFNQNEKSLNIKNKDDLKLNELDLEFNQNTSKKKEVNLDSKELPINNENKKNKHSINKLDNINSEQTKEIINDNKEEENKYIQIDVFQFNKYNNNCQYYNNDDSSSEQKDSDNPYFQ